MEARHVAKQLGSAVKSLKEALPATHDTLLGREIRRALGETRLAQKHAERLYRAEAGGRA